MELCVLSSGSRANAVFVRSGGVSLLIDCGLSAREVTKRLASFGVGAADITAIVVSHEHNDHVAGIPVFARQTGVRVFSTSRTTHASRALLDVPVAQRENFCADVPFEIPPFRFEPLRVDHDAVEPLAFRVSDGRRAVAVVTDLGHIPLPLPSRLLDLDAIVLEANHDLMLLEASPYPWELKQRIRGMSGHLSNDQAAELLSTISGRDGARLQCVIAAHVSEKANDPQLALEVLQAGWRAPGPQPVFFAASPTAPTPLFDLERGAGETLLPAGARVFPAVSPAVSPAVPQAVVVPGAAALSSPF